MTGISLYPVEMLQACRGRSRHLKIFSNSAQQNKESHKLLQRPMRLTGCYLAVIDPLDSLFLLSNKRILSLWVPCPRISNGPLNNVIDLFFSLSNNSDYSIGCII